MHKLCFYVPETHLDAVKTALFQAGAGKIGDYDCCCWQTLGQGQFRPLPGSDPFVGNTHVIETVAEYKVEMVFDDNRLADIVKALKQAHPYEEPAYDIWKLLDV